MKISKVQARNLATYFHLPRNSISHFSVTTGFISYEINSVGNSIFQREVWFRSSFRLILAWIAWQYRKSIKCYILFSISMPKPYLLQNYRLQSFVEKLNLFSHLCLRWFDWNLRQFGLCFKILIGRKFKNCLYWKNYLYNDNRLYPSLQAWVLLWRSHRKTLVLCRWSRLSKFPIWSLHPNFVRPMDPIDIFNEHFKMDNRTWTLLQVWLHPWKSQTKISIERSRVRLRIHSRWSLLQNLGSPMDSKILPTLFLFFV